MRKVKRKMMDEENDAVIKEIELTTSLCLQKINLIFLILQCERENCLFNGGLTTVNYMRDPF